MVTQFRRPRWKNCKVVRKTRSFWLRSASLTQQFHYSSRLVVLHSPNYIIAIESKFHSTSPSNGTPKMATAINNYRKVTGNVFDSKDSIAICLSANFKLSAGISRHFKRKYLTKYPKDLDHSFNPLWPSGYLKQTVICTIQSGNTNNSLHRPIAHVELLYRECEHTLETTVSPEIAWLTLEEDWSF